MKKIVVDPDILKQSANRIGDAHQRLNQSSREIMNAANGAPDYEGQFGPKVRAICNDMSSRTRTLADKQGRMADSLQTKAQAFATADLASLQGFTTTSQAIKDWQEGSTWLTEWYRYRFLGEYQLEALLKLGNLFIFGDPHKLLDAYIGQFGLGVMVTGTFWGIKLPWISTTPFGKKPTPQPTQNEESEFGRLIRLEKEKAERERLEKEELERKEAEKKKQQSITIDSSYHHINQFQAMYDKYKITSNADCGPTSLVMALASLGLNVAGANQSTQDGEKIFLARKSMVSDATRDGIDDKGEISTSEHKKYTTMNEVINGAKAAGAKAEEIKADAASIQQTIENGGKVVVSGTFEGKDPLPWTENRPGRDNSKAPGGATKHLIAVIGYDAKEKKFIVADPARGAEPNAGPFKVTADVLESFMKGNAGAVSITR